MIYQELKKWIAQSESWQAFIDYRIADEQQSNYSFYRRPQDFYISLMSKLQDVLEEFYENESEQAKIDLLSIAKGLEIYSLNEKKENFSGVNYNRNLLYVAALYYLSDFPSTSCLLLKKVPENLYETNIEKFIYYFLSRNYSRHKNEENPYFKYVIEYLRQGNERILQELFSIFENMISPENEIESHLFVLTYISRSILKKFSQNNLWYDLSKYGNGINWKTFIRYNIGKDPQVWNFFPSQQSALQSGLLNFTRAFSLQTPTSSGKTTIAELIIYNEIAKNPNHKVLYLAPFRALASELKQSLGKNLIKNFKINVKTIYGGNIVTDFDRIRIEQCNVLISTPEKFMALELNFSELLNSFQTIICDEGHLIDDPNRGISYELLLSRLKNNNLVSRKFVFLSAIIPNIEIINSWLGGTDNDIARSNYRPTQIELAFLKQVDKYNYNLEVNPSEEIPIKYILNKFLSSNDFNFNNKFYKKIDSYKAKSAAAALKSLNAGAVAIFTPTKDNKQGVHGIAAEIINQEYTNLPKPIDFAKISEIKKLEEYFTYIFGEDYLLTLSVKFGFLYHHGDLPQFIRELIEKFIRKEFVRLLVCTNTLSEGVNLPIKTLVISCAKQFDNSYKITKPLPLRNLKNLIGRAGRAGKETKGTIIVVNPSDYPILLDVIENNKLEEVKGFLYHVVEIINNYLLRNSAPLSNDLLDQLQESDYIDNSIIQLLAEDLPIEYLDEEINKLIQNTLTFYQSDESLKTRLYDLFILRSQKIKPIIEANKLYILKYSGLPLRSFSLIENVINYEENFLSEIESPLDERWINFLFDILYEINDFVLSIPYKLPKQQLIQLVVIWIEGAWYNDIAKILNKTIAETLSIFKFIEYSLQNHAASIIKYLEIKRISIDKDIPFSISHWTNYLVHGVNNLTKLDLIDINIPDRILVENISNWIESNDITYDSHEELLNILKINRLFILEYLITRCPTVSYELIQDFLIN